MKVVLILLACIFASSALAERVHYTGYKVLRLTPRTEDGANLVKALLDEKLIFWDGPHPAGTPSDVLFPPHLLGGDLIGGLIENGVEVKTFVDDVERLIEEESAGIIEGQRTSRAVDFNFAQYHTLANQYSFLDAIAAENPTVASIENIGNTFENRQMKMIKISRGGGGSRPAIWFDANIHAREWITSAVCLYMVNELITSTDPTIRTLTEQYDWYILCNHNPDGFEYSRLTDRMWRKTRSSQSGTTCRGVDANRNWGFHWNQGGSSTNPCDAQLYHGPRAFSEPETQHARDYQESLGSRLKAVISLHSYSQLILIPYGVRVTFPRAQEHMRIGQLVASAIATRYNTRFTPGNIVDLLYVASGGSTDWSAGVLNVPITFTYELRDTGTYGFLLPANQIVPSSLEFLDGLKVLIRETPSV